MKLKPAIFALAVASLGVGVSHGQTTLSVGDISFISAEADANGSVTDGFSIVTWQSLAAGTVLKFTDNGMSNAAATAANTSEHAWTFTVGASPIAAGTTLSFGYGSPTASKWNGPASGTTSSNLTGFTNSGISTTGDQIFIYQGSGTGANIATAPVGAGAFTGALVSGINFGPTITSGNPDSNQTYAPTSLVNGDAYVSGGNFDNGYYNGVRNGLSNTLYRAATHNLTNFTFTETLNASYDRTTSFTIAGAASIHWDANGGTAGDGGAGTWDTTTNDRFKNSAAGTTRFRWVNSSTDNDHTAVFGGTADTVTVSGGVTASGLKFDTSGYTLTSSTITLSGSTTPTIDTGAVAATINSELAGTQGFTKTGAGTLTLGGANSYSGTTLVSEGKLVVTDTIGSSAVTVSGSGAILATDTAATIGSTLAINSGAILAVGDAANASTASATVTGATTFNNGSIFSWDINAAGTSFDKLIASGIAGEAAPGAAVFRIVAADATFGNGFWDTNRTWTDIFTTDGSAAIGNWATIFGNTVSVVNSSFNPITPVDGSFSVSGNTLTWTVVPEPTSALAGLLLGAGLLRRRRVA